VLFVVVNKQKQTQKRKHKPIPADILADLAKINDVQVIPGQFKRSESSELEKKGSGELGDIYVNKLYDEFVDFCVAQMRIDLNDKRAETVHKKELIRGDNYAAKYNDDAYYTNKHYNNVLNYLIVTTYTTDDPDPLERLVPMIENLGIHVSDSPSLDYIDDESFQGYDVTHPTLSIIYADFDDNKKYEHDNKNIYIDITLVICSYGVVYSIDFSDDDEKYYIQEQIRYERNDQFPIYVENQTNVLLVLKTFKTVYDKFREMV
jgi:hypothetical protein